MSRLIERIEMKLLMNRLWVVTLKERYINLRNEWNWPRQVTHAYTMELIYISILLRSVNRAGL